MPNNIKATRLATPDEPAITVKEARKILGKESLSLSDTQILEIINTLTLVARRYLSRSRSKKTVGMIG